MDKAKTPEEFRASLNEKFSKFYEQKAEETEDPEMKVMWRKQADRFSNDSK